MLQLIHMLFPALIVPTCLRYHAVRRRAAWALGAHRPQRLCADMCIDMCIDM